MTLKESTYEEFARRVIEESSIDAKLRPPAAPLIDGGWSRVPAPRRPGRPADLEIQSARTVKVPPVDGLRDVDQRQRIVHGLANHELQAAELYAWALLAFEAPLEFRADLYRILLDEQRHSRMYIARLEAMGGRFGMHPVSGYFWNKIDDFNSPLKFICSMALTFENANLDHTVDMMQIASEIRDPKTRAIAERIHRDEIEHVRFGWKWLNRLKPPQLTAWQTYEANLAWPISAGRAVGRRFYEEARAEVGMSEDFLTELYRAATTRRHPAALRVSARDPRP